MSSVLREAQAGGYAVPAFNVCNLEYAKVVIQGAEKMQAPVIVGLHPVEIEYAGLAEITGIIRILAEKSRTPVVVHLDHGDGLERAIQCIAHGFTSVMFDGSVFNYETNVERTREIVKAAHALHVDVEAELGIIGGVEGDNYVHAGPLTPDQLTDPDQAVDFIEKTGIDSLAVAIGTAHGLYRSEPKIDVQRLKDINRKVSIPLVLHGGSGTPEKVLKECITSGICKVNIASELKYAFHTGMKEAMESNPNEYDPRAIFAHAAIKAEELVFYKLNLMGAAGKA